MLVNNAIEVNLMALCATTPSSLILVSFKMLVKKVTRLYSTGRE